MIPPPNIQLGNHMPGRLATNIKTLPETLNNLLPFRKRKRHGSILIFIGTFKLNSRSGSLYALLTDVFQALRVKLDAQSLLGK